MLSTPFSMLANDGLTVYVNEWAPSNRSDEVKGIIEIVHGMAETSQRYAETAERLVAEGYHVYALDLRGHGHTVAQHECLGYAGIDGHNQMVKDILLLGQEIQRRHSARPIYLMGHSMGSFLVQKVMYAGPDMYKGFILMGSCGRQPLLSIGEKIAQLQCLLQGDRKPSVLLNAIVFGPYNRQFSPIRTPFDWLSRDSAEVDKFLQDPHCGELCSAGFFLDFFRLLQEIHKPKQMSLIPKGKPVMLVSGEQDPVGHNGKGIRRLIRDYQRLGLEDITWKLYPDARHELLHELNKEEVMADLCNWLDQHPVPVENL